MKKSLVIVFGLLFFASSSVVASTKNEGDLCEGISYKSRHKMIMIEVIAGKVAKLQYEVVKNFPVVFTFSPKGSTKITIEFMAAYADEERRVLCVPAEHKKQFFKDVYVRDLSLEARLNRLGRISKKDIPKFETLAGGVYTIALYK